MRARAPAHAALPRTRHLRVVEPRLSPSPPRPLVNALAPSDHPRYSSSLPLFTHHTALIPPIVRAASVAVAPFLRSYSSAAPGSDATVLAVVDKKTPRISLPALKAVDREYDIVELLWCAQDNLRTAFDSGSKPYLPYSSHMFGAGKTTLGEKWSELLTEGEEHILPVLEARNITKENVRDLASAKVIVVNLRQDFPDRSPAIRTFKRALYTQMYMSAAGCDQSTAIASLGSDAGGATALISALKKATGKNLFYLFVDEIGTLETLATLRGRSAFDDLPTGLLDPYRVLLEIMQALLKTGSVFAYIAGKSDRLSRAALKQTSSPCQLELLPLGPLTSGHVATIIRASPVPELNQSLLSALKQRCQLAEARVPDLAQKLVEWTAGVPRQVRFALEILLGLRCDLSSVDKIEGALNGRVKQAITINMQAFQPPELLSDEARQMFAQLLVMHLHNIPFQFSTTLYDKPLLDWISSLGLYVVREPSNTPGQAASPYRLVVSLYTIEFLLQHHREILDERITFLALLLREFLLHPGLLDQGRFFERLVLEALLFRLGFSASLAADPVLRHARLLQHLPSPDPRSLRAHVYGSFVVPTMTPPAGGFRTDQWLAWWEGMPENAVCIADKPNSAGPDLHFKFAGGLSGLFVATKNLHAKTGHASWAMVRDELAKTLFPFSQQVIPKHQAARATLLFMPTKYAPELDQVTKAGTVTLQPGYYGYNEKDHVLEEITGNVGQTGEMSVLHVPSGTELVLVSPADLEAFLGPETWRTLHAVFARGAAPAISDVIAVMPSWVRGPVQRRSKPFELESFLRNEAKIKECNVQKYLPLLKKNAVDEAGLRLLTNTLLKEMGIKPVLDRARILDAAKQHRYTHPAAKREQGDEY